MRLPDFLFRGEGKRLRLGSVRRSTRRFLKPKPKRDERCAVTIRTESIRSERDGGALLAWFTFTSGGLIVTLNQL